MWKRVIELKRPPELLVKQLADREENGTIWITCLEESEVKSETKLAKDCGRSGK
jgi:hypothetical protein